jgi:hypothetical protein
MPRYVNRGFWMVAGTMALGAVILLVEIFANRPMVNAISRTENDLNTALRTAEGIYADGGTFTEADADALGDADDARTYIDADRSATTPGIVSVYASGDTWAAARRRTAARAHPKLPGRGHAVPRRRRRVTGTEALGATETQW